jgi:signal transduction histidine kinase
LKGVIELIDDTISKIRSLTFEISPPLLFEVGLEAAVEWFGEKLYTEHGLLVSVGRDSEPAALREESRILLFQVVRELLVNVVKHAMARRALVAFESDGGAVLIRVEDDGRGFDAEHTLFSRTLKGGFGLFNVRQKVEYAGGEFLLDSAPGKGTRVTVRLPEAP